MLLNPKTKQPLRIFYVDGPGDVAGTYRQWRQGTDDAREVSLTFSGDVYSLVRDDALQAHICSTHFDKQILHDANLIIEHRPVPSRWAGGLKYHLGEIRHAFSLIRSALKFKADAIVVADQLHWFALYPLHLMGRKIIVMLHCAFWPAGFRRHSTISKVIGKLNGFFWRHAVDVTLCISPEVERQVRAIAREVGGDLHNPILQVRSQYHQHFFANITPPHFDGTTPFCVLFAGRLERDKGIFDLLEIAQRLQAQSPGAFTFELCGNGSDREVLTQAVATANAAAYFHILGPQDQTGMSAAFSRSHAVIVPTNAGFAEGMNRVSIEGVLAGRPVITSPVSHVADVLSHAIIEVPTGDLAAYITALTNLRNKPTHYAEACAATKQGIGPFYDRNQSYRAALHHALTICFPQ